MGVCLAGGVGFEVREELSQSQQLFLQSHGLQLESPDTMA